MALSLGLNGEVINADAFQMYRGMDIGTAKLSVDQRCGVPHHLLDVLDIAQDGSVAAYQRNAREASVEIESRGGTTILVGGSGLYLRAVIDDLDFPGTDPEVRERIENGLRDVSDANVHARLASLDPIAAEAVAPANRRRVVRALEVIELTGQPFSATLPAYSRTDYVQIGLEVRDPAMLDDLVERRVHLMVEQGFVAEVEGLEAQGLSRTRTAFRAIGYSQMLAHLRGAVTLEEAIEATALATRRLIRKQRKWFRRDRRIHWLDALDPDLVEKATELAVTSSA